MILIIGTDLDRLQLKIVFDFSPVSKHGFIKLNCKVQLNSIHDPMFRYSSLVSSSRMIYTRPSQIAFTTQRFDTSVSRLHQGWSVPSPVKLHLRPKFSVVYRLFQGWFWNRNRDSLFRSFSFLLNMSTTDLNNNSIIQISDAYALSACLVLGSGFGCHITITYGSMSGFVYLYYSLWYSGRVSPKTALYMTSRLSAPILTLTFF